LSKLSVLKREIQNISGWPLLADPLELEGVRSVGAVKKMLMPATGGCEGTEPFQPPEALPAQPR
jgi:hypothetical protein